MNEIPVKTVRAGDLTLAYRELGSGPPVLLLHGWPTSSHLWRNIMPPLATHNRVIALDLPGFGASDKPRDASYSFRYQAKALTDFLHALDVSTVSIVGHDLGGPIGLYWASQNPERIHRIAMLNTLIYPEFSWAVIAFGVSLRIPGLRSWLTSSSGLRFLMRAGVVHKDRMDDAVLDAICAPFQSPEARQALHQTFMGLHPGGFRTIADWLPAVTVPVRVIYGENDRVLPDIAQTVARLKKDIPHAEVTPLPQCGHFLQEDEPERVGEMLAAFFAATDS
ncbi:MAG: alpha/beta fold hydrolase [Candidatus Hydrogenedentes bacterium]|nr:alpha/beta fold hydrolase [Candidatus Hydrogenedentota bacterium]